MSAYETASGALGLLTIIGDPIAQARSPQLVNDALSARGIDTVRMVPLHVTAAHLGAVVAGLRGCENFHGSIITMPHKETVLRHLDALSREAEQVGACNVIRRDADGRLCGTMLDGEGFVAGLLQAGHAVKARRVFLAGAGGAASGIAFALGRHGAAAIAIHNRSRDRAEALAARVRAACPDTSVTAGDAAPGDHDLVVNATALGMRDDDPLPFDIAAMAPGALCADVVIRHGPTPFLAEAARRGHTVHGGIAMLDAQIALMVDYMLPEGSNGAPSGPSRTPGRRLR